MTVSGKLPQMPENHITQEQLDAVAGGGCTPAEYAALFANLQQNYEDLVQFTSYVIERVAG